MLNVFPDLLSFGLLAPFMLRLALVAFIVLIYFLKSRPGNTNSEKVFSYIFLLAGAFLLLGIYTQIAAILTALLILIEAARSLILKQHKSPEYRMLFLLAFFIALSLLFSGAGAAALDIPL
jgi:hypothetical protein